MRRFLRTALPFVAVATFSLMVLMALMTVGDYLGWDSSAYVSAAHRILEDAPLFDASTDVAGPRGQFLYPPPFAVAFIPLAILPAPVGLWLWAIFLVCAFVAAVAILPVDVSVRWAILLLGALDWPVLYSLRLGQVGPVLLLLFAIGWRWMDRPIVLGMTMAAGALIKLQPLGLLVWAGLLGRWRAVATAVIVISAAVGIATVLVGPGVWPEYLQLIVRISSPVTTPHNFTLGAFAYQSGIPESVAALMQLATMVFVVAIVLYSIRKAPPEVSYLTTVVASQLLSPILWDHYAVILLLPVAWLLQRRQWWAAAIPLLTSIPVLLVVHTSVYLLVFALGFLGPLLVTLFERRGAAGPRSDGVALVTGR